MFPKRRIIAKGIPWCGFLSTAENTITATLLPGFTTRRISVSAFAGSGNSIRAFRHITASNESVSRARLSSVHYAGFYVREALIARRLGGNL